MSRATSMTLDYADQTPRRYTPFTDGNDAAREVLWPTSFRR